MIFTIVVLYSSSIENPRRRKFETWYNVSRSAPLRKLTGTLLKTVESKVTLIKLDLYIERKIIVITLGANFTLYLVSEN